MMNLRNLLMACALGGAVASAAMIPAAAQVSAGIYVQTAPPAPIYETVPAPPGASYIWEPGYWNWNGYRYVWRGGYYALPPYAGAAWRPGHWAHGPYGYYWRPGHWARRYY